MGDKELLELAAKAAGIRVLVAPTNAAKHSSIYCWINKTRKSWNPLTDDGDALRLAVKLNIDVDHNAPGDEQLWVVSGRRRTCPVVLEEFEGEANRLAATRRAIVRAAAEIGRAMP